MGEIIWEFSVRITTEVFGRRVKAMRKFMIPIAMGVVARASGMRACGLGV